MPSAHRTKTRIRGRLKHHEGELEYIEGVLKNHGDYLNQPRETWLSWRRVTNQRIEALEGELEA